MRKLLFLLLLIPLFAYPQANRIYKSVKVNNIKALNDVILIEADTLKFKDNENGLKTLAELVDSRNISIEIKVDKAVATLFVILFFLTCMLIFFCCLLIVRLINLFYK